MNRDVELDQLRRETIVLRQTVAVKDEQMRLLKQENHSLRQALKETFQATRQFREQSTILTDQVNTLTEQVKALQEQQAKDSHNSHLPPSSDRFGKRKQKSLRKPSGKKQGGQPGHQGHHLQPMAQVDEVILHRVQECQHCHHNLESQPAEIVERRQVIDFPEKRLWITEHQTEEKRCPMCLQTSQAVFPETVKAKAQYGPHAPVAGCVSGAEPVAPLRTRQSTADAPVFGLQVSAGSLVRWVGVCSQTLTPVETRIKEGLRKARVIHQDETGVRVRKHRSFVHVCSTTQLTHYGYHRSRGRVALEAIGILPGFEGTSVHDGLKIYPTYPCQHALCNVHHLRELTFVEEELKQPWATKMKELLLDMKEEIEQARQAGHNQLDVIKLANFHFQYGALIREGFELNPKAPPPPGYKRMKQSPTWNRLGSPPPLSRGNAALLA
jgi:transposase